MAERPKFGITEDPEEVEQEREAPAKTSETEVAASQKFGATAEHVGATPTPAAKPATPKPAASEPAIDKTEPKQAAPVAAPSFGADTDQAHEQNNQSILAIFSLQSKSFWLKAYAFSLVGAAMWVFQVAGNQPATWKTVLLVANLILYPFTSALLKAYGSHTHLPVPRIAYILFGTNDQMEEGLGGSFMTLIILFLRFWVFVYEWRFSVILGVIGILVMQKQLK